ncbi:MAG: triose-phosphate isomerase [Patescibacteria group bacterium]
MKPLIVANWKSNPQTLTEAKALFAAVKNRGAVICPPFVYLFILKANGAQDIEVSPAILKEMGVEYVILGHSSRRKNLNETDEIVGKKIKAVIKFGLKPILCVDSIAQTKGVDKKIILAFEPISAIGTGKPFDIQKAKKMRESLSRFKTVLYGGSVNSKNAKDYIKEAGFQGLLVGKASLDAKEFISIIESVI